MRADEFTTMSTLEEFNLKKAAAAGAMALGALGANAQGIMPGDQPEIRVQQPQAEVVRNGEDIIVKYDDLKTGVVAKTYFRVVDIDPKSNNKANTWAKTLHDVVI